ncbi:MAG: polysaccharide biosynthesis protein [Betaproteobacteria bacterium]|nr:polysaccharide biosynthesis protein [Betaproteobacteria bacterium]
MLRSFLKDSAYYGLATVLSRGISFLLVPLYTHVLSPAAFGSLDLLLVFANLITLTVALEVSQAVQRFYPDTADGAQRRRLFSTALWFSLAAYLGFAVFAWLTSPVLAPLVMGQAGLELPFRIGLVYILVNGLFVFLLNQLRCELRSRAYSLVSFTASLFTTAASVLLTLVARQGLAGLVAAMAIGSAAGLGLAIGLLRQRVCVQFDVAVLNRLLRFALPLVPSGLAVFLNTYVDRLLINRLLSTAEVGVYGFAIRIATLATVLMVAFQGSLTPLLYARYREPDTPAQLARLFRGFVVCALIAIILLAAGSRLLVAWLAPAAFAQAEVVIAVLALALLLAQMYIFAPGPALQGKTHLFWLVNGSVAVLNVLLNLLLIPRLGLAGAALATALAAFAGFCGFMAASQRLYPVPHRWPPLIWACVTALVLAALLLTQALSIPVALALLMAMVVLWWRLGLLRPGLEVAR